jgi:opacity protein-like surface antigen
LAADLPVVPAAPPAVALAYQWSGFYFGANGGGAFARVNDSSAGTFTNIPLGSGAASKAAGVAGGQLGFNVTFGSMWVIGGEADLDWSNLKAGVLSNDLTNRIDDRFEALATFRGRVGVALNNWLIYATGGGAWTTGRAVRNQLLPVVGAPAVGNVIDNVTNGRYGWSAGGGVEVGLTRNWTIRAEYLYLGFKTANLHFPASQITTSAGLNMQLARAALNYKFDWGGQTYIRN